MNYISIHKHKFLLGTKLKWSHPHVLEGSFVCPVYQRPRPCGLCAQLPLNFYRAASIQQPLTWITKDDIQWKNVHMSVNLQLHILITQQTSSLLKNWGGPLKTKDILSCKKRRAFQSSQSNLPMLSMPVKLPVHPGKCFPAFPFQASSKPVSSSSNTQIPIFNLILLGM